MRRGFALPAVLAITGVVCLALLAAVGAVDSLGRSAREAAERGRFEATALDREARATFAVLTGPWTETAVAFAAEPLRLDGSVYAAGGATISLQDESGLVNLNTLPVEAMPRLIAALGVAEGPARRLAARLADYLDTDQDARPDGAEADAYRRADLPPPADGPLAARTELLGVLGLDEAVTPEAWRAGRTLFVTDSRDSVLNVNVAPVAALVVRYGLSDSQATRAVALRQGEPFTSLEGFGRAVGAPLIGDAERGVGRLSGRLRFQAAGGRTIYDSRIVLTPTDPERPFRIGDRVVSLRSREDERKHADDAIAPAVPWD